MKRVHDPILFQNAWDSIDLKDHIVATYYIKDHLPGADFMDHFQLVQSIITEGSTGTWEKIEEHTDEVQRMLSGKLVGYYEIPVVEECTKCAVIQIAFPINAWHDNVPMMLLSIAGNYVAYSDSARLLDVYIPDDLVKSFKGPKFGVEGTRELLGIRERPLSLHIIKPKMGMTPEQTADQVYRTALGGADMSKDDEMTSDTYNNNFRDRLKHVMAAIDRAAQKTGKRVIYFCSITDEVSRMHQKAREAVKLGANGLLIAYSVGLSAIRDIASDPEINIPIMVHPSHMVTGVKRIAWPVFAKLIRLCGADQTLTPTYWSSTPVVSLEEGLRSQQVSQAYFYGFKKMWAMPAAGIYPGLAPNLIMEYGKDIIIPSGGGMLGHPDGYEAGARAWQQAIASVMEGVHITEYARRPGNQALKAALGKWGYIDRPTTPWLRVAPKFHPKPFKMD